MASATGITFEPDITSSTSGSRAQFPPRLSSFASRPNRTLNRDYSASGSDPNTVSTANFETRGPVIKALVDSMLETWRLRDLPEDWDSYGASVITETAIGSVMVFLSQLAANFPRGLLVDHDTLPIATGGVQLEWSGEGGSVEVIFESDGERKLVTVSANGHVQSGPSNLGIEALTDAIRKAVSNS